jgi:DNA-directed RNA polymerase specialized sigma24 family protein
MKAGEPLVEISERSASLDFSELFHTHYVRIARVIARVVQDQARAEELAAEVFWKFWSNPEVQDRKPCRMVVSDWRSNGTG